MIEFLIITSIPIIIGLSSYKYHQYKQPSTKRINNIHQQFRLPHPHYHHTEYHNLITKIINDIP